MFFFYGMMHNDHIIIVLAIKHCLMKICTHIRKYLSDIHNITKVGFKKETQKKSLHNRPTKGMFPNLFFKMKNNNNISIYWLYLHLYHFWECGAKKEFWCDEICFNLVLHFLSFKIAWSYNAFLYYI